jgi:hypothetical protein
VEDESFARTCPEHGARLQELSDGSLRCPRSHRVGAWLVVDLASGAIVAAGRATRSPEDAAGAIWLGPELGAWPA